MKAWVVAWSSSVLGALVYAPSPAFAADEVTTPVRTDVACNLSHFEGKLVNRVWPEACRPHEPCRIARELTLETGDGKAVFGVDGTTAAGGPGPPSLACSDGFVVLRYLGEELRFDFHGGHVRLAPAERVRISGLWAGPEARTPSGIDSHALLARTLDLVRNGIAGLALPRPSGVDDELVELMILVSVRDQLRAGQFQAAEDVLTAFDASGAAAKPSLPRKIATRVSLLRHELAEARRRTLPFSLGPRRFVGGAERLLRTPLDVGGPPELFFRGAELCVVDVAPALAGSSAEPAWPEETMHCFVPEATSSPGSEPREEPRSSLTKLGHFDGEGAGALLAVLDGDAVLEIADGELALVRGSAVTETISPARARELVAGSAGTRLVTRTASYFSDSRHIAQVAGAKAKTWDIFGKPPDGVSWVGTPLVSPDERWVVAQSGDGSHAVSLWVFPIR